MNKSVYYFLKVACITAVFALVMPGYAQAQQHAGPMEQPHEVLILYPGITLQTMTGFGAGFNTNEYIDNIKKPEDRNHAYSLLYGPQEKGVRLNIIRLTISPNAQELQDKFPPHAQGFKYDWDRDQNTQSIWKAIQPVLSITKPIIYAVPFTPPIRWKRETPEHRYNPKCNPKLAPRSCGGELNPSYYQDYAEYLADFVDYYHKFLHVDIDVLSIQNEPGVPAPWLSCLWNGKQMKDFLKILKPIIRSRGLNTKMMLSEGTAWSGAWDHLEPTLLDTPDSRALPLLDIMASHSYGHPLDPARKLFANAAVKYNLPVWMSEMSLMYPWYPAEHDDPTMQAALQIADYIHRDIVVGRASVWIYCFAIFTYDFKGSMGVLSPANEPGKMGELVIPKRFWAMANYSQFVRPGWKVIQVDGSLEGIPLKDTGTTGFISPAGDSFIIVALNPGNGTKEITYNFGNWSIGPAVDSYCTSNDFDLSPNVVSLNKTTHQFIASLPPMSVTTFNGKLVKP